MRLKLDENIGHAIRALLAEAGHDVDTVVDEHLGGASDDAVLRAAVSEGRALVTFDVGFANPFRYDPASTAGIAVLRLPKRPTAIEIAAVVDRLVAALRQADLEGHLWVVRTDRARSYRPPAEA